MTLFLLTITILSSLFVFTFPILGDELHEFGPNIDTPLHYAAYVARAVESGLNDATELFEVIEPALYKQG